MELLYLQQGKYEKAEKLLRKDLAISRKVNGDQHTETATSLDTLAGVLLQTVRKKEEVEDLS